MRSRPATLLAAMAAAFLCSCDPEQRIEGDAAPGPDADQEAGPDCEDLGETLTGAKLTAAGHGDRFETCGVGPAEEVAYLWRAPERGLYDFSASGPSDSIGPAVALLDGECGGDLLACDLGNVASEMSVSTALIYPLEAGQQVTVVVEPVSSEADVEYELGISAVACPWETVSSPVPLETTFTSLTVQSRALSCSETPFGMQELVGWVVPADGTYTIEIWNVDEYWEVGLGVFDGDCLGPELACSAGALAVQVTTPLTAGQTVMLALSLAAYTEENPSIGLRIAAE